MFLSWWRNLVNVANPKNEDRKHAQRRRIPRKFRTAVRVEQLEDRVVPAGTAKLLLNMGTPTVPVSALQAGRSATVPVFIDISNISGSTGVGTGTYYVVYDPSVLSIAA